MNNSYKIIIILILLFVLYKMFFKNIYIIHHDNINDDDNLKMIKFTKTLNNWYPIGDNKFTIDYSKNYFNFFKSIGNEGFHVVYEKDNNIYGSFCARFVRNSWYLCDLKVHPDYRGNKLTYKLFLRNFLYGYFKSGRGYAISMYPNPSVAKLNKNFKLMNMTNLGMILIYLVNYDQIKEIYNKLVKFYKHKYNGFLNTNNMKKLILDTSEELNVLHFYHKDIPSTNLITDINKEYTNFKFFFCILEKDLNYFDFDVKPYGKATLYARKMDINEFNDLGTYEI